MIGSAPGEKLPPWPAATHGPGLKPYVTEAQAIDRLPRNANLHDVRSARRINGLPRDSNAPLKRTITCSGVDASHYSGLRNYTPRELACLQGFPLSHMFEGHCQGVIKKQIGNAFPPCVVKVIYQHLRRWLERVDGLRPFPSAVGQIIALPGAAAALPPRTTGPLLLPATSSKMPVQRANLLYEGCNGDLSEDDALEVALQASRDAREPIVSHPPVINLEDSNEEDRSIRKATEGLDRLRVAVPEPDLSPPSSASSSSQNDTPRSMWDFLPSPMTGSRASSVTLGSSPAPSPSLRAKRKLDALRLDESEAKMGSSPKRGRIEGGGLEGDDGDGVEIILKTIGSSSVVKTDDRVASVSSFASRLQREGSFCPTHAGLQPNSVLW